MNRYGFALLGSLSAIISARMYVLAGGNLNYSFLGYQLHHFYYGLSLLVIAGIQILDILFIHALTSDRV